MTTPTHHTLAIAFFGSILGGFIYGYDIGVYSGAILEIQSHYRASDSETGTLIALYDYAEALGVCFSFLGDRLGRRRTLMAGSACMTIVPILPLLDHSFSTLMVTRALSGFATGYIFVMSLVFVSEVARPAHRAMLLSLLPVALSGGYLAELAMNEELVAGHGWRYAIAWGALPALVQFLGLAVMPESPTWFRLKGLTTREATARQWYGLPETNASLPETNPGLRAMLKLLGHPFFLRGLRSGLVLVFATTCTGIYLCISYGPLTLRSLGITDQGKTLELLTLFSVIGFFAGLLALIPIARGYTKHLLLGSLACMTLAQTGLTLFNGAIAVGFLGLLQTAYSLGVRTTVFQLMPGLFQDEHRTLGVAALNLIIILVTGILDQLFPVMFSFFGNMIFAIYFVLCFLISIALLRLPRTELTPG